VACRIGQAARTKARCLRETRAESKVALRRRSLIKEAHHKGTKDTKKKDGKAVIERPAYELLRLRRGS